MPLTNYICTTCGVQYEASETPPVSCAICEDDRQYVGLGGQRWTTLAAVNAGHKNIVELVAPNVYAIYSTPPFGINQRAHLIVTPGGNILWDCITNLDASTIAIVNKLGGIKAIALSHPHYFSTIVEWSQSFSDAPVYINALDAEWLGRRGEMIREWTGQLDLWDGIQLVCCGGHFPGASVLHWAAGKGSLFVGDTIQVAPNRQTVSFMYSYPNMIPLPKTAILQIQDAVKYLEYDAMYGAFGLYIKEGAQAAMRHSVQRYLEVFQ
ncbi:MAG: beta-lactamase [Flaviaesturariibacter sp.]|nr:beta-lactamase [Flaviaesturariibacter sp.]